MAFAEAGSSAPAQDVPSDRFLAQARQELDAGNVDAPLWTRALAQAGGDESAALPLYLRSRATAIRVLSRGQGGQGPRAQRPAGRAPDAATVVASKDRAARHRPQADRRVRIIALAAVALVAVAGATLFLFDDAPAPGEPAAVAVKRPARPAVAAPVAPAAPAPLQSEELRLVTRVIELREKGEWNPMVLLATQWTRQAPSDPLAWEALTLGYVRLGQWQDAAESGARAVQLAPDNANLWRQLGQAHLERGRARDALTAFGKAVALDAGDVDSLVHTALLHADLGQLAEARTAYDKALALKPDDVAALCGSIALADRQGRRKEAEPAERQLRALNAKCAASERHPGLATFATQQVNAASPAATPAGAASGPAPGARR